MGYYEGKGKGWDENENKSVNAVIAESQGKFSKTKWRNMSRRELSDTLATFYCLSDENHDKLMSMSRAAFLRELECKEAHHVGKFRMLVDYLGLPEKWEE